jgi:putative endonuclease
VIITRVVQVTLTIKEHQNGKVHSTKDLLPVKLITYISFNDKSKAYAFEKYLKSGSGRAFLKKHLVYSPCLR